MFQRRSVWVAALGVLLFLPIFVSPARADSACSCGGGGTSRGWAKCKEGAMAVCVSGGLARRAACVPLSPLAGPQEPFAEMPSATLKLGPLPADEFLKTLSFIFGYEVIQEDEWDAGTTLALDTGGPVPLSTLLQTVADALASPIAIGKKLDTRPIPEEVKQRIGQQPTGVVTGRILLRSRYQPSRDALQFKQNLLGAKGEAHLAQRPRTNPLLFP